MNTQFTFTIVLLLTISSVYGINHRQRRAHQETAEPADLNSVNFEQVVGKDKGVFVDFFAPWCGHCQHLMPTIDSLAQQMAGKPVVIAKVNAVANRDLADRFGVNSYPTLKYFPAGSMSGMDYDGGRDIGSLTGFINSHMNGGATTNNAASASRMVMMSSGGGSSVGNNMHMVHAAAGASASNGGAASMMYGSGSLPSGWVQAKVVEHL